MLIEDLQVALKVAEFRSITAAAISLNMLTATASAALKRVENDLGVDLFIRTTRQLRLSAAGELYLPQCDQALKMLKQARQTLKNEKNIVDGELRISLPSDLGRNLVIPWLDEFMAMHEKVSIKVHVSDSNVDFYRDPVDMALRYSSPSDANLYGFKICDVPGVLCASPKYIKSCGRPQHPHDLTSHNGLFYQIHDFVKNIWEFSSDDMVYKIKMKGNRVSNDADLVRRWCIEGHGVAMKSCLDLSSDLLDGHVIQLLPDFTLISKELWLVCPSRQSITPAVRLLRDMLKEKCAGIYSQLINQGILAENIIKQFEGPF